MPPDAGQRFPVGRIFNPPRTANFQSAEVLLFPGIQRP